MHADQVASRGVKRSVKDRLGVNFVRSSPPRVDQQAYLKRQCQDNTKWSKDIYEEQGHVIRNNVSKDMAASSLQKDVLKSSKNSINTVTEVQNKVLGVPRSTNASLPGVSKGRSAAELMTAKKPATQPASLPSTAEKKHVVTEELTVATFLQKLGLSKYLITFQAEEIDMFALKHMNGDDLKAIGLPMGPRKKILFGLTPAKAQK